MALNLQLDYPLKYLVQPGYHSFISTKQLSDEGFPDDDDSAHSIWRDKATHTLLLRPQQLEPDFLDTLAASRSPRGLQFAVLVVCRPVSACRAGCHSGGLSGYFRCW